MLRICAQLHAHTYAEKQHLKSKNNTLKLFKCYKKT